MPIRPHTLWSCTACLRAQAPDEADNQETLQRVGMQRVLAVELRGRLGQFVGQPVVAGHQAGQVAVCGGKQLGLTRLLRDSLHEVAAAGDWPSGSSGAPAECRLHGATFGNCGVGWGG